MTPEEKRKVYFDANPSVYRHYIEVKNRLNGGV